ncbi:hypothetical protein NJ7G_0166 [Natrinema sp. J7-2]|nr:hypothetical protein NJ7G_0166 [Natrinema sp. J7-2]
MSTATDSRTTGSVGRSVSPVSTLPISRTTSIPSVTLPKTEWRPSRCSCGASAMKNWKQESDSLAEHHDLLH